MNVTIVNSHSLVSIKHITDFVNISNCICLTKLPLTHRVRVTHISVSKLTIIGADSGLSSGGRQAISWSNVGILFIGPLRTNFNYILIQIYTFHPGKPIWKCYVENGGCFVIVNLIEFAMKQFGKNPRGENTLITRFMSQHEAHLGPVFPTWAPCRPH